VEGGDKFPNIHLLLKEKNMLPIQGTNPNSYPVPQSSPEGNQMASNMNQSMYGYMGGGNVITPNAPYSPYSAAYTSLGRNNSLTYQPYTPFGGGNISDLMNPSKIITQPFTQFVDGKIVEHPCNGNGGSSCECGGSCGKTEYSSTNLNFLNYSTLPYPPNNL
jgi:hypothetical protein